MQDTVVARLTNGTVEFGVEKTHKMMSTGTKLRGKGSLFYWAGCPARLAVVIPSIAHTCADMHITVEVAQ